jgi:hypothetical protein
MDDGSIPLPPPRAAAAASRRAALPVNGEVPGDPLPPGAEGLQQRVVVLQRGGRPVGALVEGEGVRWVDARPSPVSAVAVAALAVGGATAVGLRWAARPTTIRRITMGPGGWVSVRGARPPLRSGSRPWWARLLHAYRL